MHWNTGHIGPQCGERGFLLQQWKNRQFFYIVFFNLSFNLIVAVVVIYFTGKHGKWKRIFIYSYNCYIVLFDNALKYISFAICLFNGCIFCVGTFLFTWYRWNFLSFD